MAEVTQVGITSGVPTSGDGEVPTLAPVRDKIVANRNKLIFASATTITRPANTTAYAANDAVSDHATAASVVNGIMSFTFSEVNDDPFELWRARVHSTDTGLGGNMLKLWLYSIAPVAGTDLLSGDNAAFSVKRSNFLGSMQGTLEGFQDGSAGILVPRDGLAIFALPTSGAKTIFGVFSTPTGFTPSANSTTITASLEGRQGRA